MSYVLSVIHPPIAPAAFGKADVSEEVIEVQHAADIAGDSLIGKGVPTLAARSFANDLAQAGPGVPRTHEPTGLTFRIDPANTAHTEEP